MQYSTEWKTVYITVDELFLLGARTGSIAEQDPVFEKSKQSMAMCDNAAESDPDAEQYASASCRIHYHGITYAVTADAELLKKDSSGIRIYSFASQGGRQELDKDFCDEKAKRLAAVCGVFYKAYGHMVSGELTIRYSPKKAPERFILDISCAQMFDTLYSLVKSASELIYYEIERKETRISEALHSKFPYPSKRSGQSDFMTEAYRSMKNGGRLICEAPTGIGKTVSALYPAVKALGHGHVDKVFYFTPKTTAQLAATNALKAISGNRLCARSISMTAKEKLCSFKLPEAPAITEQHENKNDTIVNTNKCEQCPMSHGFYSRVREAILFLLDRTRYISKEDIIEASEKFTVCPYELSLEISEYCDVVICDYNYIFDPRVYLRRYFDTECRALSSCVKRENYSVLIDEAHNLSERAKSMYSHSFSLSWLRKLCISFGKTDSEINAANAANKLCSAIEEFRKDLNENVSTTEKGETYAYQTYDKIDDEIFKSAGEFVKHCEDIRKTKIAKLSETALEGYFDLKDFLAKAEWFSSRFKIVVERHNEKIVYKMMCLDPAEIIDTHLDLAKSSVLFSATISPIEYYSNILGCDNAVKLTLPSPYERDKLMLTVFDRLSTRYIHRSETAETIADIIFKTVNSKMGNYIIYFPSYNYLSQIYSIFNTKHPEIATLVQSRNMSEWEKDSYIAAFEPEPQKTLVGFCVLGGVFAEGIDLAGKRLIGTVIVGVGLPRVSLERDLLAQYYINKDEDGYMYSYVYPGMTRILQAVGRVIRTECDNGVAILLDDRFAEPRYKMLFPEHWRHAKFCEHTRTLEKLLSRFWEEHD